MQSQASHSQWRGPAHGWRGHTSNGQGPVVDQFEIVGELGRGGMGVVYKARDTRSGRFVALKVVLDTQTKPERIQRFRREGQIAASLDHPGILRIFGAGQLQGMPYLAYELVEGCRPLNEAFLGLPLEGRVGLVRDVARALGVAHAKGVVHRDLKPDNLLVDGQGRVRVADFGLATAQDVERLTQTGALLGTPNFMAPEQFDSGRSGEVVGPHSDVWAMGVVLYQALTGELPFDGPTLFELAARINSGKLRRPRAVDKRIPAALEAVCMRALSIASQDRYADGGELADDLDRALRGDSVEASGYGPLRGWLQSAPWLLVPLGAVGVTVAVALLYDPSQASVESQDPGGPQVSSAAVADPSQPKPGASTPSDDEPPAPESADSELPITPPPASRESTALLEGLISGVEGWAQAEGMELKNDEDKGQYLLHKGRAMRSFDMAKANAYFRQAVEYGNPEAARLLGESLLDGKSCEPNAPEAFTLFLMAAEGGDIDGMTSVADMLRRGKGVPKDEKRAYGWYLKAAEVGNRGSMVKVFREYERGEYLPKDPTEAKFWRDAAIAKGWKPKRDE